MRGLLVISIGLLGGTTVTRGADATAPVDDSISAAKRDFESLKAIREHALHPPGDRPRLSLPEMQTSTPQPPVLPAEVEKAAKAKRRSGNWLIEEMEKGAEDAKNKGEGRRSSKPAAQLETWLEKESAAEKREFNLVSEKKTPAPEHEKSGVESVSNPLAPFLAGWMTARDYALLQPGTSSSANGGTPNLATLPGGTPAGEAGLAVTRSGGEARSLFRGPERSALTVGEPAANPYLPAMTEAAPALERFTPPTTVTLNLPSAPAPASYAPLPPPVVPARIPDFVKPVGNERYFKPLKRF